MCGREMLGRNISGGICTGGMSGSELAGAPPVTLEAMRWDEDDVCSTVRGANATLTAEI